MNKVRDRSSQWNLGNHLQEEFLHYLKNIVERHSNELSCVRRRIEMNLEPQEEELGQYYDYIR